MCDENHVAVHSGHSFCALLAVGRYGARRAPARRADEQYVLGRAFDGDLVVNSDLVDLSCAIRVVAETRAGDDDHKGKK